MWSSVAIERSRLLFLPGPALRELALQSAPLAVALLDALAFKARCYSAMAQMLGTRSVTERLQRLLIFLSNIYGSQHGREIVLGIPFTHGDLANLIGATRQWVTVQLSRMQARGIIPNTESSAQKLFSSELHQRTSNTAVKALGQYGMLYDEDDERTPQRARWGTYYLATVSETIGAGTSEIQRNVIATRGLGLPRG